jgi:hypothetical protein
MKGGTMPNRSRFPLTGPPRREDTVFVLGAVLLILELIVLVSGLTLLSRIGGEVQLPALFSNAASPLMV